MSVSEKIPVLVLKRIAGNRWIAQLRNCNSTDGTEGGLSISKKVLETEFSIEGQAVKTEIHEAIVNPLILKNDAEPSFVHGTHSCDNEEMRAESSLTINVKKEYDEPTVGKTEIHEAIINPLILKIDAEPSFDHGTHSCDNEEMRAESSLTINVKKEYDEPTVGETEIHEAIINPLILKIDAEPSFVHGMHSCDNQEMHAESSLTINVKKEYDEPIVGKTEIPEAIINPLILKIDAEPSFVHGTHSCDNQEMHAESSLTINVKKEYDEPIVGKTEIHEAIIDPLILKIDAEPSFVHGTHSYDNQEMHAESSLTINIKKEYNEPIVSSIVLKKQTESPFDLTKDSSDNREACPTTDLKIKLERENEEEPTDIVRDLVGYLPGQPSLEPKYETQIDERHHDHQTDNSEDYPTLHRSIKSPFRGVGEETGSKSPMKSKMDGCLRGQTLADVYVQHVDIFSKHLRKGGEIHASGGSCISVHCSRELKYTNTLPSPPQQKTQKQPEQNENPKVPLRNRGQKLSDQCQQSDNKYRQGSRLNESSTVNIGERPSKCRQSKFEEKGALGRHLRVHTAERPHECNQFPAKFEEKADLGRHLRVHTAERPHECNQCPAKFKEKADLGRHLRVHTAERPHECNRCPAKFKGKDALGRHLRVHTAERPHECNQCPAKFKGKDALGRHLKLHTGERPYECNQCPAKFKRKDALECHLRVHTGERPFECKECQAKFKQKGALDLHLRVHTGERPYECKQCPAKFTGNGSLGRHLRTHTDERPHECNQCPAKFKRKDALGIHLRMHTGERPFECKECQAKFMVKSTLDCHLRVHTGERPYACKQCPAKFTQKRALDCHLRVHTGEAKRM